MLIFTSYLLVKRLAIKLHLSGGGQAYLYEELSSNYSNSLFEGHFKNDLRLNEELSTILVISLNKSFYLM